MSRKALFITYVFPPSPWVGGQRTTKYCKFLGGLGWEPIVLTARPSESTFLDMKLLNQIPRSVEVHRTWDIDPAKWEARLAARKLRRTAKHSSSAPNAAEGGGDSQALQKAAHAGVLVRLKQTFKALLKDSPDSHIFWVPFALLRGIWILLTRDISIIYSSTPPHSAHIVAWLLGGWFRKPYVLDFRDPWNVTGSVRSPTGKIPTLLSWETRLKQRIVRSSARVICVSEGEREELRAEFPDMAPDRFAVVTNGFDPDDFAQRMGEPKSGGSHQHVKLKLIHAGTIYPGIASEFFSALELLADRSPDQSANIEVRLLGEIAHDYINRVQSLEARGVVINDGYVPHARALDLMNDSDVLVILMGGQVFRSSHLPSKGFEYLQIAKPILAIAPDGELATLVRRSGLGQVVRPGSVDELIAQIDSLCAERLRGPILRKRDDEFVRQYERRSLARQLALHLDSVCRDASGRGS